MGLLHRCILLLCCLSGTSVYAHDRSESFSEWSWRGDQLSYSFSVLQREVTRIPGSKEAGVTLRGVLETYLGEQITVSSDGQVCAVDGAPVALRSREGFLRIEGSFRCIGPQVPAVKIDTFFDFVPTHTHYAKVRSSGQVEEFLLTGDRRSHIFSAPGELVENPLGGWQAFIQYVEIGARHILAGADHLAFLFGLILLAGGWREMAWLISGFTLGHSVSLALATLGFAQPNGVMVEALIGFTIALVAIESTGERSGQMSRIAPILLVLSLLLSVPLWWLSLQWELVLGTVAAGLFAYCYLHLVARSSRPGALRLLVTSTFGVIHGFGFAGGLLESDFQAADVAFVLLGFNVGVEIGQLAVLIAVLGLLVVLRHYAKKAWLHRGANATASVLSGLGVYWFVSRLIV